MLEQLFGSKTRVKLLRVFFQDTTASYFVRELSRHIDIQINAIRRELALLEKLGIIVTIDKDVSESKKPGARLRKYYRVNTESLLYPDLHALLEKGKMMGEQYFVNQIKEEGGDIAMLVLTGCFTNEVDAVTDMLLVGDIKAHNVEKLVAHYEKEFGQSIRYTFMTKNEFFDRRHVMDKFLFRIFEGNCMRVINNLEI